MVRQEDAMALVTDAAQALAARGHEPVISAANSVRLVRLGALMLAEFGVGTARETGGEDDDQRRVREVLRRQFRHVHREAA